EAARERPEAAAGFDRAAREEDPALVVLRDRGRDQLGIEIEHEAAPRADRLLAVVGRHRLPGERAAAERAEADRGRTERVMSMIGTHEGESSMRLSGLALTASRHD